MKRCYNFYNLPPPPKKNPQKTPITLPQRSYPEMVKALYFDKEN